MEERQKKLSELHTYIEGIDKEITMILQNLQWDRKHLLEGSGLVSCKYDCNHRVAPDKRKAHEERCFLRREGYAEDDKFLPHSLDDNAPTAVKLSNEDITQIIAQAAAADPTFRRGEGRAAHPPLTAERLQATYSADERRAIHDAVLRAAPDELCVDDLALPGSSNEGRERPKSKLEVLAELRDMRRRRTKYRTASAASRNYSNVLRDVIRTQMELFTSVIVKEEPKQHISHKTGTHKHLETKHNYETTDNKHEMYRQEHRVERDRDVRNPRDRKHYEKHSDKHRHREDKWRDKHVRPEDRYDEQSDKRYEKRFRKDRNDYTKQHNDKDSEHSRKTYKKKDEDKRDRERHSSKRESYIDDIEIKSERSYTSEKYEDSSRFNSTTEREQYSDKYEESRHKRRHHKRRHDEVSYDTRRKRH